MSQSEIRQNIATKEWVIYAPGRGERPSEFWNDEQAPESLPEIDPRCPFCPGNEHQLPTIIMHQPSPDSQGWQTRVVPNRYPALTPEGSTRRIKRGIYLSMAGYGRHEVIIESPRHNVNLATMRVKEISVVIETYHQRYVDVMRENKSMIAILFRNNGHRAGASLQHPHSQLIVTGIMPRYRRWQEDHAQHHFDEFGECVYCEILNFEARDARRIIAQNNSFLAFVPFAAEVPFEIWILPRRHQADFSEITDEEKGDLAEALQEVLSRLYTRLHNPHYNFMINTPAQFKAGEPQLHWYIHIRPRLTTRAGFEIGSGISINPTIPEDNVAFLNHPKPEAV